MMCTPKKKVSLTAIQQYGETETKVCYLKILNNLARSVSEGDCEQFKRLSKLIGDINDFKPKELLTECYENLDNPFRTTNIVILACKYNQLNILQYMFMTDTNILNNLSDADIGKSVMLPNSEDDSCHNSFYYAIRSSNVDLLTTLIYKWPSNYFEGHLAELDNLLATAYEELKLKDVDLSEEMQNFVEDKLVNLRFFDVSVSCNDAATHLPFETSIEQRVELVLEKIYFMKTKYSAKETTDRAFLFMCMFVAKNIYILKRQWKESYNKIPWEEIEFCTVNFVCAHTKPEDVNILDHFVLNTEKLLIYLENFAKILEIEKYSLKHLNVTKLRKLPSLKREQVVADIIKKYPALEGLYNDYKQLRDLYSLQKITYYVELALQADVNKKENRLVILKALQITGECLKNTLESPKLSSATSNLLLLSTGADTQKILTDLRNSLSHSYSLCKRTEIEENADAAAFVNIQNDLKKIKSMVADILSSIQLKMIIMFLEKIINSPNVNDVKDVGDGYRMIGPAHVLHQLSKKFPSVKTTEGSKIEKLVNELSTKIPQKTENEKRLFSKIATLVDLEKSKWATVERDYTIGLSVLMGSISQIIEKIDQDGLRVIKFHANKVLEYITPTVTSQSLKDIADLAKELFDSISPRTQGDTFTEIQKLWFQIFYIAQVETGQVKWVDELRDVLSNVKNEENIYSTVKESNSNSQLIHKLSLLKGILSDGGLINLIPEGVCTYKSNKQLQVIIEMLVLDILSIFTDFKNCLPPNMLFLDQNFPVLTGKELRNHLAHGNVLVDALQFDSSLIVLSHAVKFSKEGLLEDKILTGQKHPHHFSELRDQFDKQMGIITNQEELFVAVEKGYLQDLKTCIQKGADVNGRSINSWSVLHFACKGASLEVLKYLLAQNLNVSVKNGNHQSLLHIAAMYGQKRILEFLVKDKGLYVNEKDCFLKTPLHMAAQNGHKCCVEVLLKYNADTRAHDVTGKTPLHFAVWYNHQNIVKVLIAQESSADANETHGGFTSLHIAAEKGFLGIVKYLVDSGASVDARNDKGGVPLHTTALNGHLEVVKFLILKGTDVNAKVVNGCTPLHYAVENGHVEVAKTLIEHGACVNFIDKFYYNTPLHYAAKDGHKDIAELLLKNKANLHAVTVDGMTPLHFAAQSGHEEIVELLIKHKSAANSVASSGMTALHFSAENGHSGIARILLRNGAKMNLGSYRGLTPLHIAAHRGHAGVVETLLEWGADINVVADGGFSPLHMCIVNGHEHVVDVFVKSRAKIDITSRYNLSLLQIAAVNGSISGVKLLEKNGADVNSKGLLGLSALHSAAWSGNVQVAEFLIRQGAEIEAVAVGNVTPLHLAVENGHKDVVDALLNAGANVNANSKDDLTPLCLAVKYNYKSIVEVLLSKGADANYGKPLLFAVFSGFKGVVEMLLKHKEVTIDIDFPGKETLLHVAAKLDNKFVVRALLSRGADMNAVSDRSVTPLYTAAQEGHTGVVETLIGSGADVGIATDEGVTPLEIAAANGHARVVEVLLSNGASVDSKDHKNRTPLEMAISHGHLECVNVFLKCKNVNINSKSNDNWTPLHIAAQEGSLEITKILVEKGADINAKNALGSKPIHIAAREGKINIVEFYLSKGLEITEVGATQFTLLHYAAVQGWVDVVKYLVRNGANINARDATGSTPVHVASAHGGENVLKTLINLGASYNDSDMLGRTPLDVAKNKSVIRKLTATKKLFDAAKNNNYYDIDSIVSEGAVVDAKDANSATALHYAAWKGCTLVVSRLLQNGSDPNLAGKNGWTPLHYASKFAEVEVVKVLLSSGAKYNVTASNGKLPVDFAVHKDVINLFKLVDESFKDVESGKFKVMNKLKKVKDIGVVKAVMGANNKDGKSLIVVAILSGFPKTVELKEIFQDGVSEEIDTANLLCLKEKHEEALNILNNVLERRMELFGPNNPATLDIQVDVAKVVYKQGHYQKALSMLKAIYGEQKKILGSNNTFTLSTESFIALVLYRQGKGEEALKIYKKVCPKQKQILGDTASETLSSQVHMGLVLNYLGKNEEALKLNREVYQKQKMVFGVNHPVTLSTQNNMAMVLGVLGKTEEALMIYKEVLDKRRLVLGENHSDTIRVARNMEVLRLHQNPERLEACQDTLNIQKNILGEKHIDTLHTQYSMANILLQQGKLLGSLKLFTESLNKRISVLGPKHPEILDAETKIKMIEELLKFQGIGTSDILKHFRDDLSVAADSGQVKIVEDLIRCGVDVDTKDSEGRAPLHFAVNSGHTDVVNLLLKSGCDVSLVTNKGNTPLHTATSKGYREIVQVLLNHVKQTGNSKFDSFINAKTINSGSTALHVAAKFGFVDIVKLLLKYGALYDVTDKIGKKTPLSYSKCQGVTDLLKLVGKMFDTVEKGNREVVNKLKLIKPDELAAVTGTRNSNYQSLLQVAVFNKHKDIASCIVKLLQQNECSDAK